MRRKTRSEGHEGIGDDLTSIMNEEDERSLYEREK
jgi:hypothetical protein